MLTGKTKHNFEEWYTNPFFEDEYSSWERTKKRIIDGFYLLPISHRFVILCQFFARNDIRIKCTRIYDSISFKYSCTVNGSIILMDEEVDYYDIDLVHERSIEIASEIYQR